MALYNKAGTVGAANEIARGKLATALGSGAKTGASAIPTTMGIKQLATLPKYINGGSDTVQGVYNSYSDKIYNDTIDAAIEKANSANNNVTITNDNSSLANAISSAASKLGDVYSGYVNAQAAAANAANAASREAQERQFSMNKELMDLQNQETRNLMQWSMDYSTSSAKAQRDWEERMSNTAYQRAMADMRAAGLNPILAYTNGGAQTPTGATAAPVSGQAAGSSVGTYSGQSYHINDTMAVLGSVLGVLGNIVNSGKSQQAMNKFDEMVVDTGDKITSWLKNIGNKYFSKEAWTPVSYKSHSGGGNGKKF